ncbi:MAG: serine/threonine protein kinase, partial [Rhodothermales bacterium]|nr:serine/threonine protein kinase [Rhodothermales bacterium]
MSKYTKERWTRLTELLGGALDRSADERNAWLADACSDDPTLIDEVVALVEAHEHADRSNLLEEGAIDLAPAALDAATSPPRVGQYRLVSEIGRGGMSTVWLAERADGLFDQRVAVKMLQAGFLPEERRRRFEAERRILASLQHPNIARLLDGGVTESGQPYLVMEYVDGTPVTEFCATNLLGVDERLRLFSTICEAVAFAHRNLVVHRDLKPSNIFVTADGTVKLLDFGIAKLIGDETDLPKDEALTRTGQILLTPEYAAPEQVRGDPVTTATDVYSLGVVLYELLVGRRPYEVPDRAPSAMEKAILESQPSRPSTAVRSAPP